MSEETLQQPIVTKYPYECIFCSYIFFENPLHTKWTGHSWSHFCPKCGKQAFPKELALIENGHAIVFFVESHSGYSAAKDCAVTHSTFNCKRFKIFVKREGEC